MVAPGRLPALVSDPRVPSVLPLPAPVHDADVREGVLVRRRPRLVVLLAPRLGRAAGQARLVLPGRGVALGLVSVGQAHPSRRGGGGGVRAFSPKSGSPEVDVQPLGVTEMTLKPRGDPVITVEESPVHL